MHDHRDPTHDHIFGVDRPRPGERRTAIVVAITAVMMVVEIAAGIVFGSMALLADGLHMASHAVALTVTLLAYIFARKWAKNPRFSFGAGKLNPLGAFASAVLLAGFAAIMAIESFQRFLEPVPILFDLAIGVAVVGLVVNGGCALLLSGDKVQEPDYGGCSGHSHGHSDTHSHTQPQGHHSGQDHNLRAAYIHVLADALTSVLAIAALLAGKYYGADWLDPAVGILGAIVVGRWAITLLAQTGRVLLDEQIPAEDLDEICDNIAEQTGGEVTDLHVWEVGSGTRVAAICVAGTAQLTPEACRAALPQSAQIVHATIEIEVKAS